MIDLDFSKWHEPDRKPYPLFFGLRNPYNVEISSLKTLEIMPRNLNEILSS
jgi:hypothetical protein